MARTRKQRGQGYAENQELFKSIKHNDIPRVRAALLAGANVNARSEYETPLIVAARKGYADIMDILLDAGANVTAVTNHGDTALLKACQSVPPRFIKHIVERLIAKGGNVNAVNSLGESPLIAIAKRSNSLNQYYYGYPDVKLGPHAIDIVNILLANGANISHNMPGEGNALTAAVNDNNKELVHIFLRLGLSPNTTSILETGQSISLLTKAIKHQNLPMIRDLLAHGANPNAMTTRGFTALMFAVQKRENANIVRELIARGADVNATSDNAQTALSLASSEEIARLIVNNGFIMQGVVEGPNLPNDRNEVGRLPHFERTERGRKTNKNKDKVRSERERKILASNVGRSIRDAERRSATELITRRNMVPIIPGMIASYLGGRR